MKFGPSSRIGDVLASPGPRALLDALVPGFSEHPAREMTSGLSVSRFLDFQRRSGALGEDAVAGFLKTLGTHERTVRHRGIGVESRPQADYESPDVKPGSAAVTVPAAASRWSAVEITFTGPSHGNPFTDVDLTADITAQTPDGTRSFAPFMVGDGLPPPTAVPMFPMTGGPRPSMAYHLVPEFTACGAAHLGTPVKIDNEPMGSL
ncbi:DUF5060 domain-containing protein [Yinghuangia sp. ASG 101]|uniref:DUF5060 domain-containing protein n=1 Tax=Yinghuangia sp. ASG 101 TaxID=2896848 RepID=UPI001E4D757C|nr:DUF5060 domain-containing protein [Yinghuangia sp. ASG 101]UGQ13522.1 DUF5060 domain-containing protein [Yinghuangia sp. ASG 101]